MMLYKSKSTRTALWKYGFSAPLFAGMLIFSAATASQENSILAKRAMKIIEPVNIILDKSTTDVLATIKNEAPIAKQAAISADTILTTKRLNEVVISSEQKADNPLAVLVTFMRQNIQYPKTAREQKTIGLVLARFTISNKKIVSSSIEKTQSEVLSAEVLRALKSFSGEIDLPNDSYAMSFVFMLTGTDRTQIESTPKDVPNHKGTVVIGGFTSSGPDKNEKISVLSDINTRTDNGVKTGAESDIKDFASVELLPEFEGGTKGWAEYLRTNLKYPELAKKNNVSGRVIIAFVVEKDGSLSNIKVIRGLGAGLDEESVRVLKASPKWKPGLQNGEKVRVAYTMPIFFQLPKPVEETKEN